MEDKLQVIETNSNQVTELVRNILNNCTSDIDKFIDSIRTSFTNKNDISDEDLNSIILQIPLYVYYMISMQQQIEIKKGIAAEQNKYNESNCLLNSTGTVSEKQAKAQLATTKDRLIQLAYKSASAVVQGKIDTALEFLASAKKVQQKRLEEIRTVKQSANGAF